MKTIGLIGGLSWESTAEYYRIINQETNRRMGGWHSAKMIIVSVDFQEHYQLHHDGQWDRTAELMLDAARRVQEAGADLLIIATNTVHKVADTVEAGIDIPLIHIADATARQIKARGIESVGLLGTRFTMTESFYRDRIVQNHGVQVITPGAGDAETVDAVIYDELVKGRIENKSRQACLEVIGRLEQEGARGVILGCTELPLLIKQDDLALPVFDTTTIHALAAVDEALAQG
jgi:aspartate racemase